MFRFCLATLVAVLGAFHPLNAQSLSLVSGQGQVVQEQFMVQTPFRLRAVDAAGRGIPGVAINWSVTPTTAGSLLGPSTQTDAEGYAQASFFASNNSPGQSFVPFTVTATGGLGRVDFLGVVVLTRNASGALVPTPFVQVNKPTQGSTIEGVAGTTLRGAVEVQVVAQGGISLGQPVPNVGLRVAPYLNDPDGPTVSCNGPGGVVVTGQDGIARCDLVIGPKPGSIQVVGTVGEYWPNIGFNLNVTPGTTCSYSVSPAAPSVPLGASTGSVTLSTAANCAWTAQSNATWLTLTPPTSGVGPATIHYSVQANPGVARAGTLTVGSQTVTVSQAGAGPGTQVTFVTSPTLPAASVNNGYSIALSAAGGTPPYTWSAASLPPGLSLNPTTGALTGAVTAPGTHTFAITVRDINNVSATQSFSLTAAQSGSGTGLAITNASFPAAVTGTAYQHAITTSGGCANPFSGGPAISVVAGALPQGLSLQTTSTGFVISGTPARVGTFDFTLQAAACNETAIKAFSIAVSAAPGTPVISVTSASVNVNAQLGARPVDQSITVSATGVIAEFVAEASTTNGGDWLRVSPRNASTPSTLNVSFPNAESLPAGTYRGTITIRADQASNSPVSIPVTMIVAPAAGISVNPLVLDFSHISGLTTASEQTIGITSTVPGVLTGFNLTAATEEGGNWLGAVPLGLVTPANVRVVVNSAGLQPGIYRGSLAVSPSSNPLAVQLVRVTLRVAPPATASVSPPSLVFTYNRLGLPDPLPITVNSTGAPFNFTASAVTQSGGNWLSVTSTSNTTPATLSVRVSPQGLAPGSYQGSVLIQPETTRVPVVVGVQLVVSGSLPAINSVTNGASFTTGAIAPGEIVTIFGANLGPATLVNYRLTPAGTIDTEIGETRVLINGVAAPLLYSRSDVVTAIVPYSIAGRTTARIELEYQGVRSLAAEVAVADSAPGIFLIPNTARGAILNQDNSINAPDAPATVGSIVSIYATGEGLTIPAGVEGTVTGTTVLPRPALPVFVQIGGQSAEILYAGAAPQAPAGMLQVNARVPVNATRGSAVPVVLTIGTNSSPAVTMAVQ